MLGTTYIMLYPLLNKSPLCILCHKMKVEKISTSQLLSWSTGVSCFCCELRYTLALPFGGIWQWSVRSPHERPLACFCLLPCVYHFSHELRLPTQRCHSRPPWDRMRHLRGQQCLFNQNEGSGWPLEATPLSRDTEPFCHQRTGVLVPLTPLSWPPWLVVLFFHAPTCFTLGHALLPPFISLICSASAEFPTAFVTSQWLNRWVEVLNLTVKSLHPSWGSQQSASLCLIDHEIQSQNTLSGDLFCLFIPGHQFFFFFKSINVSVLWFPPL